MNDMTETEIIENWRRTVVQAGARVRNPKFSSPGETKSTVKVKILPREYLQEVKKGLDMHHKDVV